LPNLVGLKHRIERCKSFLNLLEPGIEHLHFFSGAVPVADYFTNDDVFTYNPPATGTLGRLNVDFPVNVSPNETWREWRLVDDIVLRNTTRL